MAWFTKSVENSEEENCYKIICINKNQLPHIWRNIIWERLDQFGWFFYCVCKCQDEVYIKRNFWNIHRKSRKPALTSFITTCASDPFVRILLYWEMPRYFNGTHHQKNSNVGNKTTCCWIHESIFNRFIGAHLYSSSEQWWMFLPAFIIG